MPDAKHAGGEACDSSRRLSALEQSCSARRGVRLPKSRPCRRNAGGCEYQLTLTFGLAVAGTLAQSPLPIWMPLSPVLPAFVAVLRHLLRGIAPADGMPYGSFVTVADSPAVCRR